MVCLGLMSGEIIYDLHFLVLIKKFGHVINLQLMMFRQITKQEVFLVVHKSCLMIRFVSDCTENLRSIGAC